MRSTSASRIALRAPTRARSFPFRTRRHAPLSQINAGTPVIVATDDRHGAAHAAARGRERLCFYKLPAGDSIVDRPGLHVARDHPRHVERLQRLQRRPSSTPTRSRFSRSMRRRQHGRSHDHLESAGRSARVGRAAARVRNGLRLANSQIFCQFTDNGIARGEARLANLWRAGGAKHVHAYRFLTTITNDGTDQLDIVSQYSTDATHRPPSLIVVAGT